MTLVSDFYKKVWPVDVGVPLIRLGGSGDGSYLLPDCISGIELCLSPGTCGIVDFEKELANIYGIPCLLCDPAEDAPSELPEFLKFDRVALSSTNGPSTVTLESWMEKYGLIDASPILLTMDIEGGEIDVINSLSDSIINKIRIATIEFHYLHLLHEQNPRPYALGVLQAIDKLQKYFDIVHFKPNNNCAFQVDTTEYGRQTLYTCVEITFLHKQNRKKSPVKLLPSMLPNRLDKDNVIYKPHADYSSYCTYLNE
tara:strand:+ start:383 stop:1147 length:765 start_codon:yes stop_codon:yes gene_type:complete